VDVETRLAMKTFEYTIPAGTTVRYSQEPPAPKKPVVGSVEIVTTVEHKFSSVHKIADPNGVGARCLSYVGKECCEQGWYGFRLFGEKWGRFECGVMYAHGPLVRKTLISTTRSFDLTPGCA
jgi:hypothetical protein